jgi:hypothetical protein
LRTEALVGRHNFGLPLAVGSGGHRISRVLILYSQGFGWHCCNEADLSDRPRVALAICPLVYFMGMSKNRFQWQVFAFLNKARTRTHISCDQWPPPPAPSALAHGVADWGAKPRPLSGGKLILLGVKGELRFSWAMKSCILKGAMEGFACVAQENCIELPWSRGNNVWAGAMAKDPPQVGFKTTFSAGFGGWGVHHGPGKVFLGQEH